MIDDIFSDVLHNVRLSGAIFFEVDVVAPWVAAAPPSREIAAEVMLPGQHVMEYHVLVEGACWARVTGPDEPRIELAPGSVIAFPHGDTHVLASEPHLISATSMPPSGHDRCPSTSTIATARSGGPPG